MNVVIDRPKAVAPALATRTDDAGRILQLAELWRREGSAAMATLVEIRGGASKPLGSQMAIAGDGRYCGYVSGGCVEAAVASEALLAIAEGGDRTVMFGDGSPYFDIVLPCGGGITVAIHVIKNSDPIRAVTDSLSLRQHVGLRYRPGTQSIHLDQPPGRSQWYDGDFVTVFRPRTRLVVSGQTLEAEAVSSIAEASGFEVVQWQPEIARSIDSYTAVVLLHHDLEREACILRLALSSQAFYIGSLGSTRTHRKRVELLLNEGHAREDIERIKAPIGLFGPARDSTSLALSVLADVAAARLAVYA